MVLTDVITTTTDVTTPPVTPEHGSTEALSASATVSASPPEELYYYHVIYFSVAIILGVPGNAVVVAAYGCVKSKTSCDWYILYIGVLDLVVCLFRVPTHLAMETGHWQNHGSDTLCKLVYWLSQSAISASVVLFGFIAVDRYVKVCRPGVRISARFSRNSIAVITVVSMVFALPTLWISANSVRGTCVIVPQRLGFHLVKVYYTLLFATFIAMFVVVVVCYAFIIVTARRSQQALKNHRQRSGLAEVVRTGRRRVWRRSNRVGVMSFHCGKGEEDGDVRYVRAGERSTKMAEDRRETSSQLSEQLILGQMARRLRNPMESCTDSGYLWVVRPVSARTMRSTSPASPQQLMPTATRRHQTLQETAVDTFHASPKLIPRPRTRRGSSDNILDSNRIPGAICVRHHASKERNHRPLESESVTNTESSGSSAGQKNGDNLLTQNVSEVVFETNVSNTDEMSGLSAEMLISNEDEKRATRASSFLEQPAARNNLKGVPTAKDSAINATNHGLSELAETDQTSVQINKNFLRVHNTTFEHPIETISLSAFEDGRPNCVSNPMSRNLDAGNRTSHSQTKSCPSVFIVGSQDDSFPTTQTDLEAPGTRQQTTLARSSRIRGLPATCFSRTFRLSLLLLLVTVIFVLSWIPPYLAMVWYFYVGYAPPLSPALAALQIYGPSGYVLNHFANPLLYLALSSSFRHTVRGFWRHLVATLRCAGGEVEGDVTATQTGKQHEQHRDQGAACEAGSVA